MRLFGLSITRAARRYAAPSSATMEKDWLAKRFGGDDDDAIASLRRVNLTQSPERAFVGWAYVAISRIARYGCACPWGVMRNEKEQEKHPLALLLRKPNPLQTDSRLLQTLLLSLELWGQGFWVIERGSRKQPLELWPVSPAAMKVQRWENGLPAEWEQIKSSGRSEFYPAEDVLWFRTEAPGSLLASRSPVSAAAAAIQTDIFVMRHYSYFFEHGASPLLAISFPITPTEEQKVSFRADWQKNYEGLKRWFRPLALYGGATASSVGAEPSMNWLKLREQIREEILATFDCPPAIAGIFQNANFGVSIREQKSMFWQQALIPRLDMIADDLNTQLAPQFGDDAQLVYQYDRVQELRPDYAGLVTSLAPLAQLQMAGTVTAEEAHEVMVKAGLLDEEAA